ncbi:MAG: response regulator [Sandaracinus sp.]|nr:response regulator [Myxococcales bacterium]MCB9613670.1 response regulator [Sandaracinus sp.]
MSLRPGPYRVVLVDDEPELVALARRMFEHAAFEVVATSSPIGVGALIKRHDPDVIVLDVSMPGLDGESLARLFARRERPLPVVFWSALPETELQQIARRIPNATYVPKGSPLTQLVATAERMIRLQTV